MTVLKLLMIKVIHKDKTGLQYIAHPNSFVLDAQYYLPKALLNGMTFIPIRIIKVAILEITMVQILQEYRVKTSVLIIKKVRLNMKKLLLISLLM